MSGCCESTSLQNIEVTELLAKTDLKTFNRDVVNVVQSLAVIELTISKTIAEDLRQKIIQFIQSGEVPTNWEMT